MLWSLYRALCPGIRNVTPQLIKRRRDGGIYHPVTSVVSIATRAEGLSCSTFPLGLVFIHAFDSFSLAHLDGSDIAWLVQENTRTGELRYPDGKPENGRHKRDVTNKPSRLWPNGIVHYAFDSRILSDSESISIIYDVIESISCKLRIQWNPLSIYISTWFSIIYSWVVNTPHSVPVYISCT